MGAALRTYFATAPGQRARLAKPWERATGLTAFESEAWRSVIWEAYTTADGSEQRRRKAEVTEQRVSLGGLEIQYTLRAGGSQPAAGWPLLICLHPDGESAEVVNGVFPGLRLYRRATGAAPHSWEQPDQGALLEELVRGLVAYGGVDPNRVYLQGFGPGAQGVLWLGPNSPDRWAALAATAPVFGGARPRLENLKNTPLILQTQETRGEPSQPVEEWVQALRRLRDDANPNEYVCEFVSVDASGGGGLLPKDLSPAWLSRFARNPSPKRVLWTQPQIIQRNCYWLRLDDPASPSGAVTIDARLGGQCLSLNVTGAAHATVRLDDRLLDLDKQFTVTINDEEVFTGKVARSVATLVQTLEERGDPALTYSAELTFDVPGSAAATSTTAPTQNHDYPRPAAPQMAAAVEAALRKAGANAAMLARALREVAENQRPGLYFLIANLPDRDLLKIKADYLLEDVRLAYAAWQHAPWSAQVSEQQFLQYILPFAHFNERRDNWRRDFYERFHEQAWRFEDPLDATKWLNDTINDTLNVHYHAHKRPKSDQSPYESIAAEYASCTGLSVLLANACRAVGIPARLVGVAQWVGADGNHTWVEVWGGPPDSTNDVILRRWYNVGGTGSDPRAGDWVNARCQEQVDADRPLNRVYAACFRRSDLHFPLAWNLDIQYVPALNVTRFYNAPVEAVVDVPSGGRGQAVVYWNDEILLTVADTGKLRLPLARGETYRIVVIGPDGARREQTLTP
jgi:hypothetical protein